MRRAFEAIFDGFGLPAAIRTDTGPPFASAGPGGLSRLSTWWQKLGIRHERIAPGKPRQNGRHELLGLDPVGADAWELTFGAVLLGRVERPPGGRFRLSFVRCS